MQQRGGGGLGASTGGATAGGRSEAGGESQQGEQEQLEEKLEGAKKVQWKQEKGEVQEGWRNRRSREARR